MFKYTHPTLNSRRSHIPLWFDLILLLGLSVFTSLVQCFPVLSGRFGVFSSFWDFRLFGVFLTFQCFLVALVFAFRFWYSSPLKVFVSIKFNSLFVHKIYRSTASSPAMLLIVWFQLLSIVFYYTPAIDHATVLDSLSWAPIELYLYE